MTVPFVAILGMHRAGTSLLARTANVLGVALGPEEDLIPAAPNNPAGYWENEAVTRINDGVLEHLGGSWELPPMLPPGWESSAGLIDLRKRADGVLSWIDAHRGDAPLVGFKDPRASLLMPFWNSIRRFDVSLVSIRDPRHVGASLARRDGIDEEWAAFLWLRYTLGALSAANNAKVVAYEDFFLDTDGVVERTARHLGVEATYSAREEVREHVSGQLRHHAEEWESRAPLAQLAADLYRSLRAGQTPDSALIHQFATGSFADVDVPTVRAAAEMSSDIRRLRTAVEHTRSVRDRWRARAERGDAESARLVEQLEIATAAAADKSTRLTALSDESERLANELQRTEAERSRTQSDLDRARTELDQARTELDGARKGLERTAVMTAQLRDAQRHSDRLEDFLTKFDDRYRKHLASRRWRIGAAVGKAIDRARLRSPQETMADAILDLLDDVRAYRAVPGSLASTPPAATSPATSAPARGAPQSIASRRRDVVVYTAIAGGYDDLKVPEIFPDGWKLVCFTDELEPESAAYDLRPFDHHHVDPTRRCRYVKLHPHVYFPDHEWSVWVDANLLVRGDLTPLVEHVERSGDIGMFLHPHRSDVFEEADEVIQRGGLDDAGVIRSQMDAYRERGVRAAEPLYETNVLVRHHSEPRIVKLMDLWWREIDNGSKRDQLSFPIVTSELGIDVVPLGPHGESVRTSPLFQRFQHGHDGTPA